MGSCLGPWRAVQGDPEPCLKEALGWLANSSRCVKSQKDRQEEYRRPVEREVSQQEGENCSGEPRSDCVPNSAPGRKAGEVAMSLSRRH